MRAAGQGRGAHLRMVRHRPVARPDFRRFERLVFRERRFLPHVDAVKSPTGNLRLKRASMTASAGRSMNPSSVPAAES